MTHHITDNIYGDILSKHIATKRRTQTMGGHIFPIRKFGVFSYTLQSIINLVPCDAVTEYYKAIIEIISDSSLPSTKVDSVRRITTKFGYSR